ncbi:hypothetical protein Tco_1418476, partial [Tanacetum coccineum]
NHHFSCSSTRSSIQVIWRPDPTKDFDTTKPDTNFVLTLRNNYFQLGYKTFIKPSGQLRWPLRVTFGRLLPHARGLGFKPRRGGFPSGAKKERGLSPKAKATKPPLALGNLAATAASQEYEIFLMILGIMDFRIHQGFMEIMMCKELIGDFGIIIRIKVSKELEEKRKLIFLTNALLLGRLHACVVSWGSSRDGRAAIDGGSLSYASVGEDIKVSPCYSSFGAHRGGRLGGDSADCGTRVEGQSVSGLWTYFRTGDRSTVVGVWSELSHAICGVRGLWYVTSGDRVHGGSYIQKSSEEYRGVAVALGVGCWTRKEGGVSAVSDIQELCTVMRRRSEL